MIFVEEICKYNNDKTSSTKDFQHPQNDRSRGHDNSQCVEDRNAEHGTQQEASPKNKSHTEDLKDSRHPSDTRADLEALTKKIVRNYL